ncbi:hypothetical protein PG994_000530 [Apiospora phragmitis]|uniref:Aminoglycoside phosphotransferase domain-containing protein n=1 Tax=Apiospora phragmitis TaxID=2905665 RepID=A0ABR1X6H6_9PEZI
MAVIRGHLNSSEEVLPVTPDQVTVEWCSKALGFAIKEFTAVEIIHGTASKILIGLKACGDDNIADPRPDIICVKGGFDPGVIAIYPGLNATYRREAEFYYYIAPLVNMRLPRAWYCGSDTVSGQGIVIMDDLRSTGCTFGNPLEPWPVARGLPVARQRQRPPAVILALLEPEPWARRYAEGERPPVPDEMLDRERMRRAFQKLWAVTDPRYHCLVHGDAHIGNTYITAAGEPGLLDWQGLAVGSAFDDVPYFIAGGLAVQDRRSTRSGWWIITLTPWPIWAVPG